MSMIIYFDHHIIWVYCFKLCLLQHVGYWLKELGTFEAVFFVWNCVCLFCLFVLFVFVWLWCMTYGNSIVCFFNIFVFILLLVVFKLKSVSETAWREPPKKWDLLLLIDLIWVEDILILGYTKIFVISYIPGSKHFEFLKALLTLQPKFLNYQG